MDQKLKLLTYFPFIGWIYPMAALKNDEQAYHHAKQGFVLAALITFSVLFLYFMTIFIPTQLRIFRFSIVSAIYVFYAAYAVLCIIGTIQVTTGKKGEFPLIKKISASFEI